LAPQPAWQIHGLLATTLRAAAVDGLVGQQPVSADRATVAAPGVEALAMDSFAVRREATTRKNAAAQQQPAPGLTPAAS
jgi:hypothetical protein